MKEKKRNFNIILVTGGCGFIGSNFIRYMLANHPRYNIVNLDSLTYAGNPENLKDVENSSNYNFIKGDICDRKLIDSILSGEHKVFGEMAENNRSKKVDCIVNFAAESHVDRSIFDPSDFLKTNIMGSFTLLDSAKKIWARNSAKLFLHVSTDEVYGSLGESGYFTEETPYAPNSPYSASKASSDHLVRAYFHTYDLPVVTTNCSNNYGPFQFPEKLIPLVILNALEGRPLPIYGDGKNVRDWLYVIDHCRAIADVIHFGSLGETYNIGGNNEKQNIDLVKLVCATLDEMVPDSLFKPHSSLIKYVKDRAGHDRRYAVDSSKIKNILGWEPEYSFAKGIKETVRWYLDNKEWCKRVKTGEYARYYERQYS